MERLECDRMFVAVLDTGSFSRAAERLGTSSGQASKLVSRLEAELGVQLLKRTTRALSSTEIGRAYYERIKALLEDIDALDAAVRSASGLAAGRIRLTVPLSFGTMHLTPALADFALAYPDIQLDVSFTDRIVSLVDEGFDLAIRVGIPADSSLIARKLCDIRLAVAAAPSYLAARGEPRHPADLTGHDCLLDSNFRDPHTWRFTDRDGAALSVPVSGRLQFSNGEACLTAAEAGLGIMHGPSFLAGTALQAGRLKPLLEDFTDRRLAVYAMYPPGRHLALKVRVLVDFLAERYRGEPAWDRGWRR
ncbi:LysR substrate-binding domain-containing protein [Labrys okinawensis]|uniref:LysR family transcriptional regulator n=1 Tax=Labrys okinawensis TaxID=346911 RepID=UPI0039BD4FC1